MTDQKQILEPWCRKLIEALELQGLEVDIDEVLALAGEAAHAVVRPAAPLTTFIVGYAAGCASATGQASDDVAIRSASEVARRLVREAKQDDDGAGDGSGLDTAGEDASAAQAQEAVQATFGGGTPEGRKP